MVIPGMCCFRIYLTYSSICRTYRVHWSYRVYCCAGSMVASRCTISIVSYRNCCRTHLIYYAYRVYYSHRVYCTYGIYCTCLIYCTVCSVGTPSAYVPLTKRCRTYTALLLWLCRETSARTGGRGRRRCALRERAVDAAFSVLRMPYSSRLLCLLESTHP